MVCSFLKENGLWINMRNIHLNFFFFFLKSQSGPELGVLLFFSELKEIKQRMASD